MNVKLSENKIKTENRVKFLPMSDFSFISEIKQPSDYINFINANSSYFRKW